MTALFLSLHDLGIGLLIALFIFVLAVGVGKSIAQPPETQVELEELEDPWRGFRIAEEKHPTRVAHSPERRVGPESRTDRLPYMGDR